MKFYCSNPRCAEYKVVEGTDAHVSPRCPSCGDYTIPVDDFRSTLLERVVFCGLVGGMLGLTAREWPGAIVGALAGILTALIAEVE